VLEKKVKNREDKRHHALDAMVLTYIPQWARDPQKEGFFRFPKGFRDDFGRENFQKIREHFQKQIDRVTPAYLAFEPAVLADTIYGARSISGQCVIVQRCPLRSLAYKQEKMKPVFNALYAADQLSALVGSRRLIDALRNFVSAAPDQKTWQDMCDQLAKGEWEALPGIKVSHVTLARDEDPI
jgi:CRISPR-associated endonuclease Csn1